MKVIVENIEAFKTWLTKTLSPICDADPQALAKYVLALIKKEKEEQELRDICSDQLDVFLQEKTKEFVEQLFTVLNDKSYVPPPPPPPKEEKPPTPPPPPAPTQPVVPAAATKEPEQPSQTSAKSQVRDNENRDDRKRFPDDLRNKLNSNENIRRKSRSPYRERSPLRSRSPFRERTPPRRRVFDRIDRRRLSPDRRPRYGGRYSPDRKRRTPPRSPLRRTPPRSPLRRTPPRSPLRRSPQRSPRSPLRRTPTRSPRRTSPRSPGRRSPLRRSPARSPSRRSPSRRSPLRRSPLRRSPLRSRSPGNVRTKSKSPDVKKQERRSRSLSKDRLRERPRSWSRTPPPRRRFRPRSWSMSSSGLSSDSFTRSKSRSPPRSPRGRTPDSRGSTPRDYSPYNRTTNTRDFNKDARPTQRARCRDYDEKGFCMRGDLCPYDHGNDPVVVDDVNLPNVLQLNQGQRSQNAPGGMQVPPGGPPPPIHPMGPRGPLLPGQRPPMIPPHGAPMRPHMPIMGGPPPPPPPGPPPPGFSLVHMKGATPPPPGTVPIRMPPVSQQYNPRPSISIAPPYAPEPYNPEAPSIAPLRRPPISYFPTHLGPRPPVQPIPPGAPQPMLNRLPPHHDNLVTVVTQAQAKHVEVEGITTTVSAGPNNRTVVLGKREIQNTPEKQFEDATAAPPVKKPAFDKSRLGPDVHQGFKKKVFNPNNSTLQLKKVPREMNNIATLNQHFSKFGLITNLQVGYNGDLESALVTFASPLQAKAAHKCTEPIFNNRFVKVFWHNPENENGQSLQQTERKLSVKDRLGVIPPAHKLSLNNTKKTSPPAPTDSSIMKTPTGITKTVFNATVIKKTMPPAATQPKPQMPAAPSVPTAVAVQRVSIIQQKKEVLKKKLEIQKKKQQLLQEQLKQQKVLIGKIEKNKNITADEKNSILKTIKVLADSIEKLKHELLPATKVQPKVSIPIKDKAANGANNQPSKEQEETKTTPAVVPKTPTTPTSPEEKQKAFIQHKQQAQKAILDTELDIINKSNEGADTSELRVKVAKLKQEAMALGLLGRGRGVATRGSPFSFRGRGRGRGSYAISHVIDRRPKQLVVMGFHLTEKEDVVNHLSSFGEVESVVGDDSIPSLNINFKTRQDAEIAARDGQAYKKKRLIMTWHKREDPSLSTTNTSQSSENLQTEDSLDDDSLIVGGDELEDLDEDALLGLDEEEEGDADRSWKR